MIPCGVVLSSLTRSSQSFRLLYTDHMALDFRALIADLVHREARPVDKYGHQPRLYALTRAIGEGQPYDDDIVYAAAWLHDIGVFIGNRPEDPELLRQWDHVKYACDRTTVILAEAGFPGDKAIRKTF